MFVAGLHFHVSLFAFRNSLMIKMNEIRSIIAELFFGKIGAYNSDCFNFSGLWPSKSFTKLMIRYRASRELCSTFRHNLLDD